MTKLGTLKPVHLRDGWEDEEKRFTPWLASEEGLRLLGDTINVELELEEMEANVGSFRADIVCKNIADGSFVLIENQLGPTNHDHLGKILTYAAGLGAVTIILLASRFRVGTQSRS